MDDKDISNAVVQCLGNILQKAVVVGLFNYLDYKDISNVHIDGLILILLISIMYREAFFVLILLQARESQSAMNTVYTGL